MRRSFLSKQRSDDTGTNMKVHDKSAQNEMIYPITSLHVIRPKSKGHSFMEVCIEEEKDP